MAEYLTGTEFEVVFGMTTISFSKISNMATQMEYDTFVEGGNNDEPIVLKKPKRTPDRLVLERGVDGSLGAIEKFIREIDVGGFINNVMIFIKQNGSTKKIYYFDRGMVLSKKLSPMDALGSSVMIEELEIAHSGLKEMLSTGLIF